MIGSRRLASARKRKNDAKAIAKVATVRWMSSGGIANQPWISASTSRP